MTAADRRISARSTAMMLRVARSHPTLRGGTRTRFVSLIAALLLYGWGELLTVRADVGLGPWDVLHQAISDHTGWSFGSAVVVVSFSVLILAAVPRGAPGPGHADERADRRLVVRPLRSPQSRAAPATAASAAWRSTSSGIAVIGLASALYIGANFGAGPRDSLMLAIVHRGPRISVASWAIQIGALSLGFALGGPVGIGTVLFALGLGPCIEGAYYLLVRAGVTRPQPSQLELAADAGDRRYVSVAGTSAPPASSAAVSESSLRSRSSRASQSFIAKAPTVTLSRVPHSGQRR